MERKKKDLVVNDDCLDEDTEKEVETETFELLPNNGLGCDKMIEKIMSIPAEVRRQFDYTLVNQGSGVKIPRSGIGHIEITPPRVMLKITPKPH